MGDTLKKVKPGDPMVIPADTFNTFVDAARNDRQRLHNQGGRGVPSPPHNCIVRILSESVEPRQRYDILGVGNVPPVFDPYGYPEAFKNHPIMKGYIPSEADHRGKFVVLLEPVTYKNLARAVCSGTVPVRLDWSFDFMATRADITDQEAGYLSAVPWGSATILWRQGGVGVQWAIVRLGELAEPCVYPVNLFRDGGSQGPPSTWTYTVQDAVCGRYIDTGVDPTASPHRWGRPADLPVTQATFGYAHWNLDQRLVLGWMNESIVEPYAIPVTLVQTGGSQGPPSTWTYTVQDAVYGRAMGTNVDPTASPHQWRRPAAWRMAPATLGYAHWDSYGGFVLGWINEVAC